MDRDRKSDTKDDGTEKEKGGTVQVETESENKTDKRWKRAEGDETFDCLDVEEIRLPSLSLGLLSGSLLDREAELKKRGQSTPIGQRKFLLSREGYGYY